MYKQQYNNSSSSEEEYSSEDSFSEEDPPLNIMSNKSNLDLYNNEQYQVKSVEKKHLIFIDTGDRYFNSEYNRFNFKCKLSTSGNSWSKYPIYANTKEIPQNNSQKKLGIPGSPNMNGFIYNNIYTSNENILSIQNNIKNINCIKVKSVFIPKIFFPSILILLGNVILNVKVFIEGYMPL